MYRWMAIADRLDLMVVIMQRYVISSKPLRRSYMFRRKEDTILIIRLIKTHYYIARGTYLDLSQLEPYFKLADVTKLQY
jgi:hypothetical protein